MKISEKIQHKMKERGLESISDLYRAIKEVYADEALTKPNLYKIVNDQTKKPFLKNISQIATILRCPISDFYKEPAKQVKGIFYINDLAKLVNLNDDLAIKPKKLLLKMGGKSFINQEKPGTLMWVYVFKGEVILHILRGNSEEKIELSNTQHYTFDASIPHYYESKAKIGGQLIMVLNHADVVKS